MAVGLLWLGAGCGVPPERSSEGADPRETNAEVSDAILTDAREVASDLGISVEEAVAAIERQPQVGRLQAALKRHGPASFGGLFIDYVPEYRITLLALPGDADEVERAVDDLGFAELSRFADIRETPYSEDVLKQAMRMVGELGGAKVTTLDLDIRTGDVLATAASSAGVEAIRFAVDAADPAIPARRVIVTEGTFEHDVVPAAESVASLRPNSVRPGDRATLRVGRFRGAWGVGWDLERREGSSWEWVGLLKAGPGKQWKSEFYLGGGTTMIEDIGFTGPAKMILEIPRLTPGRYRLSQEFIRRGRESVDERLEGHRVEFDVLER